MKRLTKRVNNDVFGVKRIDEDLESHFEDLIINSTMFLAMSSYSWRLPKKLWDRLINNQCIKIAIIPYKFFKSNQYEVINWQSIIRSLMMNGVLVIINNNNHSKFMINENRTYFGSVNLTGRAMTYNIEGIASYCDGATKSPVRKDILKFVLEQLKNYKSILTASINGSGVEKLHQGYTTNMKCIFDWLQDLNFDRGFAEEDLLTYISSLEKTCVGIQDILSKYQALLSLDDLYNLNRRAKKVINSIKDLSTMLDNERILKRNYTNIFLSRETKNKLDYIKGESAIFQDFYSGILESIRLPRELDTLCLSNDKLVPTAIDTIEKYIKDNNIQLD